MRIALIGAHGQLGSDLQSALPGDVVPLGHADIEIADPDRIAQALGAARPDLVVNAAAYNLVDKAEDEPETAFRINGLGPRNLAAWCAAHGAVLLHVGSDYVFGLDAAGRTVPHVETDAPGPQGAYALSKLAGEYFVRSGCPRHFVVRTCGLYGRVPTKGKGNFVQTMLRLGRERGMVRVVDDQTCTPTSTRDLAAAIASLVRTDAYGLYHATNRGSTTWCGLAREVFRLAGLSVTVEPTTTAAFGAKAPRPSFSVLDSTKLERTIGRPMPEWRDALARYLAESAS